MFIEVGSLWTNRRGDYVEVIKLGERKPFDQSDYQMIYWQRISGPAYRLVATKSTSSANRRWFLKTYTFAEPAIHIDEGEEDGNQNH